MLPPGRCVTAGRARPLRSLRATVALKAGRGASKASRRARPRAERWRFALGCCVDSGFEVAALTSAIVSRQGLVVAPCRAWGVRAAPARRLADCRLCRWIELMVPRARTDLSATRETERMGYFTTIRLDKRT